MDLWQIIHFLTDTVVKYVFKKQLKSVSKSNLYQVQQLPQLIELSKKLNLNWLDIFFNSYKVSDSRQCSVIWRRYLALKDHFFPLLITFIDIEFEFS